MIRQIVNIACDWCEEAVQYDLPVQEAINAHFKAGWIMMHGRDFCSACRDKDRARLLYRTGSTTAGG